MKWSGSPRVWHSAIAGLMLLGGCGNESETAVNPRAIALPQGEPPKAVQNSPGDKNPLRNAYFGDLHVHTANSMDAYNFGVRAGPEDAYRYAEGAAIQHPMGYDVRLRGGPLDFYAVSDHAEYLGVPLAMDDPNSVLAQHPLAKKVRSNDPKENAAAFWLISQAIISGKPIANLDADKVIRSTWQANIEAAERHNKAGEFTTFIAYEYTSSPDISNLHRNVIFAGSEVPEVPFGAMESTNPEDLWDWLDEQRANGIEALAIPHNSNISDGLMFQRTNWAGEPIDAAYAEQRIRNEPLVEITQVKGTSETHPTLSPRDEWAGFEIWRPSKPGFHQEGSPPDKESAIIGAYARDALRAGLELEQAIGINPYQFGIIGSSDGHDAASPVEEDRYFGKAGVSDGSPAARGSTPKAATESGLGVDFLEWGASGLVGVWAGENSRTSIYGALRRRETFGTSGPRIQVRFFAGYDYDDALADAPDALAQAYADGVPMGGELVSEGGADPKFFIWAVRDQREAWLQRAQIVKGWMANGASHEQVFDVACSDGLLPDPKTHRCPDNGADVDISDCSYALDKGAVELKTLWRDPSFDPTQRAFYYLRVLQNPTCRWSTWDAIRAGVAPNPRAPATLQERAWSSPIWYVADH